MKQKGQLTILVLVGILILVGVAGGAYFLEKQTLSLRGSEGSAAILPTSSPTPSITESTPSADMKDWKTYKNPDLKYELKYPDSLQLIERDFGGGYIVTVITDMKLAEGTTYPASTEELVSAEYTQEGGDPAIYRGIILDIRPKFDVNENFEIMVATQKSPIRINNANVYKSTIDKFTKNNFQGASTNAVIINDSRDTRYDISLHFNTDKEEYVFLFG